MTYEFQCLSGRLYRWHSQHDMLCERFVPYLRRRHNHQEETCGKTDWILTDSGDIWHYQQLNELSRTGLENLNLQTVCDDYDGKPIKSKQDRSYRNKNSDKLIQDAIVTKPLVFVVFTFHHEK